VCPFILFCFVGGGDLWQFFCQNTLLKLFVIFAIAVEELMKLGYGLVCHLRMRACQRDIKYAGDTLLQAFKPF